MMQAKALWFEKAGTAVFMEERLPGVKKGWCLVETLFSSISPGTERLVFSGMVPPAVHTAMAYRYMKGAFSFPVKYGYSLVGRIADGPEERIGQIVHILHPHQDKCVVRLEDAFPVPPQVPAARATLASNCETALNALWDSQLLLGDRVLVVGFGIIGSLKKWDSWPITLRTLTMVSMSPFMPAAPRKACSSP